jgi:hypothetical protein
MYKHLTTPAPRHLLSVETRPKPRLAAKLLATDARLRSLGPTYKADHVGQIGEISAALKQMESNRDLFTHGSQISRELLPGEQKKKGIIQEVRMGGKEIDSVPFLNGNMVGEVKAGDRPGGEVVKNAIGYHLRDRFHNEGGDQLKGFYYVTTHPTESVRVAVIQNVLPVLFGKEITRGITGGVSIRPDIARTFQAKFKDEFKQYDQYRNQNFELSQKPKYYEDMFKEIIDWHVEVMQIPRPSEDQVREALKNEIPEVESAIEKELPRESAPDTQTHGADGSISEGSSSGPSPSASSPSGS